MSTKQKRILYRIIISALTFAVINFIPTQGFVKLLLFTLPYLLVGFDVLYKAARNILNGQIFDENFLMSIATIGAFAIGEYPEAVAVMLFYQIGELFQSLAVRKSRKSIASLMDIRPDTARVLRNGEEIIISPQEVKLGETIVVNSGEKIPIDGIILEGTTTVDASSLTGESMPINKTVGDTVISGTVNMSGVITVQTTSLYTDSTVAKILTLVENTASQKAKTENFITRFSKYYTPIVVIGALLLAIIPPLFLNGNWGDWINRALIFLVVSCPCALVISVPLSFFGGIGGCSKKGILVKGAVSLETLSKINTFVFDKTGTLTYGNFYIDEIHTNGISKEELLNIASAAEKHSNHPIAKCIVSAKNEATSYTATEIKEISGMGMTAVINGEIYYLGNEALMEQNGISYTKKDMHGTAVHIAKENTYLGYITVADKIKEETVQTLKELKSLGIHKNLMLTGDNETTAKHIANQSGIDEYYSQLLPDQKVEQIEKVMKNGYLTAFVGDGINDAPVLNCANVGIAMGGLGSDAAIEAADIVIMNDNLHCIVNAVSISRKTMKIVKQNIVFALAIKGIILILGALGIANMWIAVFGDVGVTVIAILNAMRTLHIKK